ncbi:hypothetical protein GCM10023317_84020 [Actinopolymorpha pittospori]
MGERGPDEESEAPGNPVGGEEVVQRPGCRISIGFDDRVADACVTAPAGVPSAAGDA